MQRAIRNFLKAAIGLVVFLLVVSVIFLAKSSNQSDSDSMMLAFLLLAFSLFGLLVLGIALKKTRK